MSRLSMESTTFRPSRRHALALGLSAAAFGGTIRSGRAASKTLRFGLSAYPPSFKPWEYTGTAAETVKMQSFRGLMGYSPEGGIRRELAESYRMEGETSYIFQLRKNAKFHNGDPVTAADVKFTFESIGAGNSTAFMKPIFSRIVAIEAIDMTTVKIVLPEPNAAFLNLLASYDAPIVSQRSMKENPDKPAGAGPYVITGMERGSWIQLEAFPDFYRPGLPKTSSLRFVVYADENVRVSALRAGDVDLIEYVPSTSMAAIESDANLKLDAVEGPATLVYFNVKDGPFRDPRVRRAVGYAIDRQSVIDGAFSGRGAISGPLPISRSSKYFNDSMLNYFARDLKKAKALLAEAGVPNGFSTNILATSQYSVHREPAIVIQQNLAEIGIQAELVLPDWPTRVSLGNQGRYHISVSATSADTNDPLALSSLLLSGQPVSFVRPFGYANADVDRLLNKGVRTLDEARRKAVYADLEKVFVEDPGILSVVFRHQAYAGSRKVEGFRNLPGFETFNSGATIENVSLV